MSTVYFSISSNKGNLHREKKKLVADQSVEIERGFKFGAFVRYLIG